MAGEPISLEAIWRFYGDFSQSWPRRLRRSAVRPATPVVELLPSGVTSPNSCASLSGATSSAPAAPGSGGRPRASSAARRARFRGLVELLARHSLQLAGSAPTYLPSRIAAD